MKFGKPVLSHEELLSTLESKGIAISDKAAALHAFKTIGYYRLGAYRFDDMSAGSIHKSIKSFERLLEIYDFDRKLRFLTLTAIERIEIAISNILSDSMCEKYGSHWFLNDVLFKNKDQHARILDEIKTLVNRENKLNPSIHHFYEKYTSPYLPPSWMLTDLMSLSLLSRIYSCIRRQEKKTVSDFFNLSPLDLEAWMRSLTFLRNLCAHHARIFDRDYYLSESLIPYQYDQLRLDGIKYATSAFMIFRLLNAIDVNYNWIEQLDALITKFNIFELNSMGFEPDWVDTWPESLSY